MAVPWQQPYGGENTSIIRSRKRRRKVAFDFRVRIDDATRPSSQTVNGSCRRHRPDSAKTLYPDQSQCTETAAEWRLKDEFIMLHAAEKATSQNFDRNAFYSVLSCCTFRGRGAIEVRALNLRIYIA